MNILIYMSKKNFDTQKAERFFKERRIPVQVMDLSPKGKHRLGERELMLFAGREGIAALIDREDKKVKDHPACYNSLESALKEAVLENPWLLRSPIVRCGSKVTVGYQPEIWESWLKAQA